ncbi:hypothetical protein [Polyangium fumosum]|uniref:Uncharacterized protein n=1 Tax=Polyangium fumosum TaxID=889272 RepID=A0A4U1JMD4_9BACT|nr:hypothetical protein [Polyangium fumosum]TKD13300.1 hypothetical protein E8A74_01755 [Polyangium fumosum]
MDDPREDAPTDPYRTRGAFALSAFRRERASGGRFAWAALLATCVAVCVAPMGCGSSEEHAVAPERTQGSLPARTVRALQACAEEGTGRLRRQAYEIGFKVELTDDRVQAVAPKGPRLDDAGLERCMMNALRTMADAGFSTDRTELVSYGSHLPARGVLANVTVLPELVKLAEVVVAGPGGVTIVIVVVVVVIAAVVLAEDEPKEEVVEAIKRWPKKVREKCADRLVECINDPYQPWWNRRVFGDKKQCEACNIACLNDGGAWPMRKCPPPGYIPPDLPQE